MSYTRTRAQPVPTGPGTLPPGSSAIPGRPPARLAARPGVALAASAPIALVVLAVLPGHRPDSLTPCILAVVAAGLLVMTAELASFDTRDTPAQAACPHATHTSWSDPAMVSVQRWLANWPGIAGVSAASWWAARAGAAGLLSATAFATVGARHPAAWGAAAVALLAGASCTARGRHLAHVALGIVAITGVAVAASGAVAAVRDQLTTRVAPTGRWWPAAASASPVVVATTTTVALICLSAVCFLAVTPGTSGGATRSRKWAIWGVVGSAVATWGLAVPLFLRAAGLGSPLISLDGGAGALRVTMATVLGPLGGAAATTVAQAVLCAVCLAGAAGAMWSGTGLAENTLHASRSARLGRVPEYLPAAATGPGSQARHPWATTAAAGAATGAVAAGVALAGTRGWLVVALGCLAAGALALTTLAPPVLRVCQRVPLAVRATVAAVWALVITIALGAAGPAALAVAGLGALSGACVIGWRGPGKTGPDGHRSFNLPWATIAAAVIATSAVTTMELLPAASGTKVSSAWQGLTVVVMGAGIVVLAVFPATSRQRVEHLQRTADVLARQSLPALAAALEALANDAAPQLTMTDMADLKAATRDLEMEMAAQRAPDELLALTGVLVEASHQVLRLAAGVESVARRDARRLDEMVGEHLSALSNANKKLVASQWRRRQLLDRTVQVAEGERARLAANLHDGPIQRLAAVGLVLDRSRLRLDREDRDGARELVRRARSELSDEIHNLRRMMSELRPPILDEGGLDAALRDHVSAWSSATGIDGHVAVSSHRRLNANSETVVYRVVQEALANVAKHAHATSITVMLGQSGDGVEAVVRDDGMGFQTPSRPELLRGGHFGMVVMRERVELAAGKFEIKSTPLVGTEVRVWLPLTSDNKPVEAA